MAEGELECSGGWDAVEAELDLSDDSDDELIKGKDERDARFQAALCVGRETINLAKSKIKTSPARALAAQRNLLAKRHPEAQISRREGRPSEVVCHEEILSPCSPRTAHEAPARRRRPGRDREAPFLVLPSEISTAPLPFRTNTPLPSIRASQSCTNLASLMPTPPSFPSSASPRRSPRMSRKKRDSLEELCDQLDKSLETDVDDFPQYHHHLMAPSAPPRSRSTENLSSCLLVPLERSNSPIRRELAPLRDPSSPPWSSKPLLKPI